MKYIGSKSRHCKIIPLIIYGRKEDQFVYDLFCGGGSICENINGNVIGNDVNRFVIKALGTYKR